MSKRPLPGASEGEGGPGAADKCPVLGPSPPLQTQVPVLRGLRLLGGQDLDPVLLPNACALCAAAQTEEGAGKVRAISAPVQSTTRTLLMKQRGLSAAEELITGELQHSHRQFQE